MFIAQLKKLSPMISTFLNAACGFIAIIICFSAFIFGNKAVFDYAFYIIILGIIFDIADGFLARKFSACSEIGAKLDSKSDAVTFGVAPAVLLAATGLALFGGYLMILSVAIAIAYLCAALFRLARFDITKTNDDERGHLYFTGMPSPTAALVCSAASVAVVTLDMNIFICLFIYLVSASCMVSEIKYADLPKHYFYKQRSWLELIPVAALFFIMPAVYVVLGFLFFYEVFPIAKKLFDRYKR
jgi:CDP-diacylglycerol--serine O-phosphatidyltransferase